MVLIFVFAPQRPKKAFNYPDTDKQTDNNPETVFCVCVCLCACVYVCVCACVF